jgi:hypothetical protein
MAESAIQFYDGAEASGKGPGSTTPEQPKQGSGPIEFFKGCESISAISVPANPSNGEGMPAKGASVIDSPIE